MKKIGIILINIGSPEALTLSAVKKYLRKFLSDPRVVSLPYVLRKVLVNCIIVPFRAKKTLNAYKKIWTKHGSPLITISQNLQKKLATILDDNYVVKIGMGYSSPTIDSTINELIQQNCNEIIILPMYPQYAKATTESAKDNVHKVLIKNSLNIKVKVINYFYNNKFYIQTLATIINDNLRQIKNYDHILFSYHGLPEMQVKKICGSNSCNLQKPCPDIADLSLAKSIVTDTKLETTDNSNVLCYRAQCYKTTKLLVEDLKINSNKYSTSFQSRLGRIPWIKPYTDQVLEVLIKQGIKDLVVICPSFVTDCLETIEEIGIQVRKSWQELGGRNFHLIPCLNDNDIWAKALKEMVVS